MTDLVSALVRSSRAFSAPRARSYASGNRPYTVRLERPGASPVFNRDTGTYTEQTMVLLYHGPARIAISAGTVTMEVGEEQLPFNAATISIDYFSTDNAPDPALTPANDDLLTVVDDDQAESGHLPNRVFQVTGVAVGGHFGIGWVLETIGAAPSRHGGR